ncbi:hypothetical protein Tco_0210435 [Tanacetum coccineum]
MKADPLLQQQDIANWLALQMKFEKIQGRIVSKKAEDFRVMRQYVSESPSSGQVNEEEPVLPLQMMNFLQSDIVWESRKEILVSPHPRKITTISTKWFNKCNRRSLSIIARYGVEKTGRILMRRSSTSGDRKEPEKRVMRPSEIHKFYDATLRRTLEGLKSYYNDAKYGYVQKELTNDEVEFLKLFKEEIEIRLNYRDQMRRWEMCVNGRPLRPRRERPE